MGNCKNTVLRKDRSPQPRLMGSTACSDLQLEAKWLRVIASDGQGWEHVSVSKEGTQKVPNWSQMCEIKKLFFGMDSWVVQFHHLESEYVNNHPGVLHLWRPTHAILPTPPAELVGVKGVSPETISRNKSLVIRAFFTQDPSLLENLK